MSNRNQLVGVVGSIKIFSGGGLSNYGGTPGINRRSGKCDHGNALFIHKEWQEITTCMKRSLGN